MALRKYDKKDSSASNMTKGTPSYVRIAKKLTVTTEKEGENEKEILFFF